MVCATEVPEISICVRLVVVDKDGSKVCAMIKKFRFLFLVGVVGVGFVFISSFFTLRYETVNYFLEGKEYKLLVADTPKKWSRGLMYRRKLDNADGMIFIFPTKSNRLFYNKNTYLDLDVYWIDGSSVVSKNYLASIDKTKVIVHLYSPREVDKVVELVRK